MSDRTRRNLLWMAGTAFGAWSSMEVFACTGCKDAVAIAEEAGAAASAGYNYSIMFMLAVPIALLGIGGTLFYRAVKNGQLDL